MPPHDLLPGGTYLSVTRAGRDGVAGAACADQRGQGEGEAIGDGQDVGCPTPCRAGASLVGRSRWVHVVVLILLVVAVVLAWERNRPDVAGANPSPPELVRPRTDSITPGINRLTGR